MGNIFNTTEREKQIREEQEKKIREEREKQIREREKQIREEREKQIRKREKQIRDLLEEIGERLGKFSPYCKNEALRLVLVGSVRAGKSSLVNNILSAVRGVLVHTAPVGNVHGHVTGKYTEYMVRIDDDGMKRGESCIVVCDTMGFDAHKPEDHVDSVREVVQGYCSQNQSMANKTTTERAHKRHAVYIIFVADATQVDNSKDDRSHMIESIQMLAQIEQIPVCLFLTFCDDLDGAVVLDMENIYKSEKVNKARNVAHLQFNGIPKARIYPIVNYTDQWKVEPQIRLLTLRALCDIVREVESYMFDVVRDA